MRHALLATLFRAILLFAPCAVATAAPDAPATQPALPLVIEGLLGQEGADGDMVGQGPFLEFNYGSLYVGDVRYLVEIPGEVMQASGVALNTPAQVRATLSATRDLDGQIYYVVSALEAL